MKTSFVERAAQRLDAWRLAAIEDKMLDLRAGNIGGEKDESVYGTFVIDGQTSRFTLKLTQTKGSEVVETTVTAVLGEMANRLSDVQALRCTSRVGEVPVISVYPPQDDAEQLSLHDIRNAVDAAYSAQHSQ